MGLATWIGLGRPAPMTPTATRLRHLCLYEYVAQDRQARRQTDRQIDRQAGDQTKNSKSGHGLFVTCCGGKDTGGGRPSHPGPPSPPIVFVSQQWKQQVEINLINQNDCDGWREEPGWGEDCQEIESQGQPGCGTLTLSAFFETFMMTPGQGNPGKTVLLSPFCTLVAFETSREQRARPLDTPLPPP